MKYILVSKPGYLTIDLLTLLSLQIRVKVIAK